MKAEVIARLMVTASEGKWEDMTPAERKRYNEKHPNNPHADTYDPKDEWWEFMTPESCLGIRIKLRHWPKGLGSFIPHGI